MSENMNYIIASQSVLQEYGVSITTERQLKDGRYICHFENQNPLFVIARFDTRIEFMTYEALQSYIEFVDGE